MTAPGARGARHDEQDGEGPVVRDRRRIDPQTGRLREPAAASGPAAGTSPFRTGTAGPGGGDPADPTNASQPISIDPLTSVELEAARQEAAERTADLQRVTAEYANYRRRVDRDREAERATARAGVLVEMLPVLDDLDRAKSHGDLTGAFGAVADKLTAVLTKLGLTAVGEPGDAFDPAVHEAVQFGTSADVTEPTVTSVFRHGYRLGDRLVRPAVVVVTGPEHDDAATGARPQGDTIPAGDPSAG